MHQLVRVHAGGGVGKLAPARVCHGNTVLGAVLPRRLRLDRGPRTPVQPAPGTHGCRLHHIQWFL